MLIYEDHGVSYGRLTSQLVRQPAEATTSAGRTCGSPQTQRVMPRCTSQRSEASRLAEFDTSATLAQEFYQDSRNVSLWAKKRAQELEADLGWSFEETVEKARTGKILAEG